jgi:succinate-semialdehyde dehydrogenase / glutarate-semialdehyde dehydrogenase
MLSPRRIVCRTDGLLRLHAFGETANAIAAAVEAGMMSINHHGLSLPKVPCCGVSDSGCGSEGGPEAIESYLATTFVSQVGS